MNAARLEKLKQFFAKDPTDSFSQYAIGLEYASGKEYDSAIETFEALRERDPNYIATYYQLADSYRQSEQQEKALATYTDGITRARDTNDLHAMSELQAAMEEMKDEMEDMKDDE